MVMMFLSVADSLLDDTTIMEKRMVSTKTNSPADEISGLWAIRLAGKNERP
jgi:hypothetical protein